MESLVADNLIVLIKPRYSFNVLAAISFSLRAYLKVLNMTLVIEGCMRNKTMMIVDTMRPSCSSFCTTSAVRAISTFKSLSS